MAEQVQAALDQMVAPLRDLMDRGIFTDAEVKAIVARRRESEYLLRRRAARKKDFLVYIEDEQNLEKLRVLRVHQRKRDHRKSQKAKEQEEAAEAAKKKTQHIGDVHIVQHIHLLFVRAIRKFRSDLSLHLAHVDFCKSQKSWTSLGRVYAEALQIFPREAGLWIESAQHEFFGPRRSIRSARILLQRGIRMNPASQDLWVEYFALELHYAQTLKGRRQILMGENEQQLKSQDTMELDEPEDDYKIAVIVLKNAIKAIPDSIPFRMRFLDTCRRFPNTQPIMESIQAPLQKDFATQPGAWIARALYEAEKYENSKTGNGNITKMEQSIADQMEDEDSQDSSQRDSTRMTKKARTKNPVVAVLEEALATVSTDEMKLQAFRFAKQYEEQQQQAGDQVSIHQVQELLETLLDSTPDYSSAELALEHSEHLCALDKMEQAVQVLEKFCTSPKQAAPASLWIRWAILSPASATSILKRAVGRIPMNEPGHMQVLLQYFGALLRDRENNRDLLQNTFQQILLLAPGAVNLIIDDASQSEFGVESVYHAYCKYLDHVNKAFGLQAARKVYQSVLFQSSVQVNETNGEYVKAFIDMAIQIERSDRACLRRLFDKVLEIFRDTPLEKEYRMQRNDIAVYL